VCTATISPPTSMCGLYEEIISGPAEADIKKEVSKKPLTS